MEKDGTWVIGKLGSCRQYKTRGDTQKPYKALQLVCAREDGGIKTVDIYDYADRSYEGLLGQTICVPVWASAYLRSGDSDPRVKFMVSKDGQIYQVGGGNGHGKAAAAGGASGRPY